MPKATSNPIHLPIIKVGNPETIDLTICVGNKKTKRAHSSIETSGGTETSEIFWVEHETQYMVTSGVVRQISPFLNGLAKSGLKSSKISPSLPNCPSAAMEILLQLAHHRYSEMPNTVSIDLLTDLAKLCESFDCWQILYSYTSSWLAGYSDCFRRQAPNMSHEVERCIFAAWHFRYRHLFESACEYVLRRIRKDNYGHWRITGGHVVDRWLHVGFLPEDVLASIAETRLGCIHKIFNLTTAVLDGRRQRQLFGPGSVDSDEAKECAMTVNRRIREKFCDADIDIEQVTNFDEFSIATFMNVSRDLVRLSSEEVSKDMPSRFCPAEVIRDWGKKLEEISAASFEPSAIQQAHFAREKKDARYRGNNYEI